MKRWLVPLIVLLALAAGLYAYAANQRSIGPLTGLAASRNLADQRPVAVMLDNYSPDARPQSGLAQASLVFEALAEGGITRFMAVYDQQDAPMIGPVRSTRLYFNAWAAGLDAIFGHDGGNVDALQQLPSLSTVYNVDADRTFGPFSRVSNRVIPHNEYTGSGALREFAHARGADTSGVRMTIPHKDDAPASQRPTHFALHIQFSYAAYNVDWQYDPGANDYLRSMGGAPHLDATSGQQLRSKNIVVMFTDESPASDPFTPGAIHLRTEGTGRAVVYRDGQTINGQWSKRTIDSPLQWLDSAGNAIPLDRGNTWVEVVPVGNGVTTS